MYVPKGIIRLLFHSRNSIMGISTVERIPDHTKTGKPLIDHMDRIEWLVLPTWLNCNNKLALVVLMGTGTSATYTFGGGWCILASGGISLLVTVPDIWCVELLISSVRALPVFNSSSKLHRTCRGNSNRVWKSRSGAIIWSVRSTSGNVKETD